LSRHDAPGKRAKSALPPTLLLATGRKKGKRPQNSRRGAPEERGGGNIDRREHRLENSSSEGR